MLTIFFCSKLKYLRISRGTMDDNQISINYEGLLKFGFGVIDARYCKYPAHNDNIKLVIIPILSKHDDFYPDMMKNYCPSLVKAKDIYQSWTNILLHKVEMSNQLKRDVSIMTAAYDYVDML